MMAAGEIAEAARVLWGLAMACVLGAGGALAAAAVGCAPLEQAPREAPLPAPAAASSPSVQTPSRPPAVPTAPGPVAAPSSASAPQPAPSADPGPAAMAPPGPAPATGSAVAVSAGPPPLAALGRRTGVCRAEQPCGSSGAGASAVQSLVVHVTDGKVVAVEYSSDCAPPVHYAGRRDGLAVETGEDDWLVVALTVTGTYPGRGPEQGFQPPAHDESRSFRIHAGGLEWSEAASQIATTGSCAWR